jgi:large subunit ribosomal protein L25
MKSLELSGLKRVNLGKKDSKNIRKEGNVPCVVYGGKENLHFTAKSMDFNKFIYTPEVFIIKLDVEGQKVDAMIQDLQFHPLKDTLLHVDLIQLTEGKAVSVELPINITGVSKGVKNGGKLRLNKRVVKVKCLPSALIDNITIDVTDLKIGDSVRLKELSEDGLTFLEAANDVVVGVKTSRKAVADTEDDAEEGAEAAAQATAEA